MLSDWEDLHLGAGNGPDQADVKQLPHYKSIVKSVLRKQILGLLEELCSETGEETVLLTANIDHGVLSSLGSHTGKSFLDERNDISHQFFNFCQSCRNQQDGEDTSESQHQIGQKRTYHSRGARTKAKRTKFRATAFDLEGSMSSDSCTENAETKKSGNVEKTMRSLPVTGSSMISLPVTDPPVTSLPVKISSVMSLPAASATAPPVTSLPVKISSVMSLPAASPNTTLLIPLQLRLSYKDKSSEPSTSIVSTYPDKSRSTGVKEMEINTGNRPTVPAEMDMNIGDRPPAPAEMVMNIGDRPPAPAEMVMNTGNRPTAPAEMVMNTGSRPPAEMDINAGDRPTAPAEMDINMDEFTIVKQEPQSDTEDTELDQSGMTNTGSQVETIVKYEGEFASNGSLQQQGSVSSSGDDSFLGYNTSIDQGSASVVPSAVLPVGPTSFSETTPDKQTEDPWKVGYVQKGGTQNVYDSKHTPAMKINNQDGSPSVVYETDSAQGIDETNQNQRRFKQVTMEDINELRERRPMPENCTRTSTKWAMNAFKEWMKENQSDTKFETLPAEEIDLILQQFYTALQSKKGDEYSKSALVGMRAGINRHLQGPPFNRTLCIIKDREFFHSNQVLYGKIQTVQKEGKVAEHNELLSTDDTIKLYGSGVFSLDRPETLQNKVLFDILSHFKRRGRGGGLHELRKDSFVIKTDSKGLRYVTLSDFEFSQYEEDGRMPNIQQQMYENEASMHCPVRSFEKYISKLSPECDSFFQRPLVRYIPWGDVWFQKNPVGFNKISGLMSRLSDQANLSRRYTNHSVRNIQKAGLASSAIISVTGNANLPTLGQFLQPMNVEERERMRALLNQAGTSTSGTAGTENL